MNLPSKSHFLTISLPFFIVGMVGCVEDINDKGVNLSSSYELLRTYIEPWQIVRPSESFTDKSESESAIYKMKYVREEGIKAADLCKSHSTQLAFDKCVITKYEGFPIQAVNLTAFISSEVYKQLKDDPKLRSLINKHKKDGVITNAEFSQIIKLTQEILIFNYEKQYQINIANL